MSKFRLLGVVAVCAGALGVPASALADTLSITTDPDPVEQVDFRINFNYATASTAERVYATIKPAGGAGCAPDYSADQGTTVDGGDGLSGKGTITVQTNEPRGSYVICAWEQQSSGQTSPDAIAQDTVAVRQIHATLSLGVPATARLGAPFQISPAYTVEQSRRLYVSYAKVVPGTACPATYSLASSDFSSVIGGDSVQGAGSDPQNVTVSAYGTYLFCGWIQQFSGDPTPAAVATATLTLPQPPPPTPTVTKPACTSQSRAVIRAVRRLAAAQRLEHRRPNRRHRVAVRAAQRSLSRAKSTLARCRR